MWPMSDRKATTGLRLVIAVVTFRRPDDLAAMLRTLPMRVAELGDTDVSVRVVIVDNDRDGSAASVARTATDLDVSYVVEPVAGVAAARNAALDAAGTDDLLVFIDDDESARPGWLLALVDTWRGTEADAVVGPVVSVFDVEPDDWAVASGIHDREHRRGLRTGHRVARAATNNLLLDLATVRRLGVRFDARFGLTGGEDSMFSGQFTARGGRIVWCAEAVVEDRVPEHRMSRDYLIARTESLANASARAELALEPRRLGRVVLRGRLAATALARWVVGGAMRTRGRLRDDLRSSARGSVQQARGRGETRAVVGRGIAPYARS